MSLKKKEPQALSGCFQRALELAADVLEACLIGHITSLVSKSYHLHTVDSKGEQSRIGTNRFPWSQNIMNILFRWHKSDVYTLLKINMSSEKEPFQKKISSSNHQFSRDKLIFRGMLKFLPKQRFWTSNNHHKSLQNFKHQASAVSTSSTGSPEKPQVFSRRCATGSTSSKVGTAPKVVRRPCTIAGKWSKWSKVP